MSLSILQSPQPIGPGTKLRILSSGPFPNDDYFGIAPFVVSTGDGIISGDVLGNTFAHLDVVLGYSVKFHLYQGQGEGVADGTSLHLYITHFHANGVLVEDFTDTGAWTWTLRSPAHNLLQFVSYSTSFSDILDAVRYVPTQPGQR